MYVNTYAVVLTPEGETTNFNINTGVLQGDPLAPYLLIIVLDYGLRTAIDDREDLTRFNKIAIPNNKFQMASGQGSHWFIESPTMFLSMCSPPLSYICQFNFFKYSHY